MKRIRDIIRDIASTIVARTNLARRAEVNWIIAHAQIKPSDVVLDIGCGTGYYTSLFASQGAVAIGVDINETSVRRAGQRGFKKCLFINASAEFIPLSDRSVDVIVGVCAMEHFSDHDAAMAEFRRILKPGGRLVMSVDSLSLDIVTDQFREKHRHRAHVVNFYTLPKLSTLLRKHGFDLQSSKYLISTNLGGLTP